MSGLHNVYSTSFRMAWSDVTCSGCFASYTPRFKCGWAVRNYNHEKWVCHGITPPPHITYLGHAHTNTDLKWSGADAKQY